VGTWRSPYGRVDLNGEPRGLKHDELRKLIDLPDRAPSLEFEIALDIHPADGADRDRLAAGGWRLVSPEAVASPAGFAQFVRGSGAEFSPAQGVYVGSHCGWFSDRTVRYLASGRPALVQDTGFGDALPVGEGLLSFATPEEAVARAQEIAGDYARHAAAARRIAEEWFAHERALAPLLEAAGVAP
jgi:hypothetical protein